MGRAGRGGGGGGSFGGSRGFGSHSGGSSHRSSFSSSHSSYHSSHHSSYHSSHHSSSSGDFVGGYILGSIISGSNPRRRSVSSTRSSDKVGIIIFLIVFVLYVCAELLSKNAAGGIQKSTIEREKLDSPSLVVTDDYVDDRLGWIGSEDVLVDGMRYFYEQTGVQPYLVITDHISDDDYDFSEETEKKFANELYDSKFTDQAHIVIVFQEKNSIYHSFYLVGAEAKTVVDDEAGEILLDYIDHYYYSDLDEDEMFARVFRESADRMMTVTPSYGWIALIFVLIIVVLVVSLTWWSKKKKAKLAEMNKAQQILGQDLNSFGTAGYQSNAGATVTNPPPNPAPNIYDNSEVDELKKKYDNMDNNINM